MSLQQTAQQVIDDARGLAEDTDKNNSTQQDSDYLNLVNELGGLVFLQLNAAILGLSSVPLAIADRTAIVNSLATGQVVDRFTRMDGYVTSGGLATAKPMERREVHQIVDKQENLSASSTPTEWAVERIDDSVSAWLVYVYPIPNAAFTILPYCVPRWDDVALADLIPLPNQECRYISRLVAAEAARINGRGAEQGFIDRIMAPVPAQLKQLMGWPAALTDKPLERPGEDPY